MRHAWLVVLLSLAASAHADEPAPPPPLQLQPQLQVDGGLSVIGPAYEQPVARQLAIAVELFVFGTYFLPWFDAGDEVRGVGFGVRPTWFARESGRGLYVAPYFRGVTVATDSITGGEGIGFTTGVFVGWAFGLTPTLDLRIGAGAQYLHFHVDDAAGSKRSTETPFLALDAVLGYRL
ncbi:MAG: hypothetical protein M3680_36640 [Myxococcota bacterium]|nr:hypothetical protein [Myxococcota bacterium]